MPTDRDIVHTAVTDLVARLVPMVNAALPGAIRARKLDPKPTLLADKTTLGHIKWQGIQAKARVHYALTDLVGLSSAKIYRMDVKSFRYAEESQSYTGTIALSGGFSDELSAQLKAKLKKRALGVPHTQKLKARVSTKNVVGTGNATWTATLAADNRVCLDDVQLGEIDLSYSPLTLRKLSGLGIFDFPAQEGLNKLLQVIEMPVRDLLTPILQRIINGAFVKLLPQCTSPSPQGS